MKLLSPLTSWQVTFFLAYFQTLLYWLYAEWMNYSKLLANSKVEKKTEQNDVELQGLLSEQKTAGNSAPPPPSPNSETNGGSSSYWGSHFQASSATQVIRYFCLNEATLLENRMVLRAVVEFGSILVFYFICDRTNFFGEAEKHYSRDLFIFLYALLVIAAYMTSLTKHVEKNLNSGKSVQYLNRHQTEEWKGWMQIIFLMYHYWEAREIYNSIRLFIAAYVWMTGFGNFSYYYVRKDFSLGRFCQMMWRLNFLVLFCCIVLSNDYMLYYICPMHTLFTIMVYAALAINAKDNDKHHIIWIKIALCFVVVIFVWEVPGVFEFVWSPFTFIMGYVDPRKPELHLLHEWKFRSGLDRYIWIVGMIYAYSHPTVERWLEKLEEIEVYTRNLIRAAIASVCFGAGYMWYVNIYCLDKFNYNAVHPYTSWIPITIYIVLRNLAQPLRNWSLALFGWLGKITLETYIGQFHIWLRTSLPNAQPALLLAYFQGYPLLNFGLASAIYTVISLRLFELTNTLKNAFVPHKDDKKLLSNLIVGSFCFIGMFILAYAVGVMSGLKDHVNSVAMVTSNNILETSSIFPNPN